MKTMKKLLAASAAVLLASTVQAAPITYTFIGDNVSGSLNGSSFVARTITFTFEGDTDDVTLGNYNTRSNRNLTGTFDIDGLGSGTFTDPMRVYKSNAIVGLGNTADIFYLFWGDAYDLVAEAAVEDLRAARQNRTSVNTDMGVLVLNSASTGSFTASYPTSAEVPEPASLALLGLGIAGLTTRRMMAHAR